jgi:hypothetical protein
MIWFLCKRKKHTCPCCGYKTLHDVSPGSHLICEICFWEDDPVQYEDPGFEGGANTVSLRQAQRNFAAFGCTEERFLSHVRPPSHKDLRDPEWQPVEKD